MTALTNISSGVACDVLTEQCSSPTLPPVTLLSSLLPEQSRLHALNCLGLAWSRGSGTSYQQGRGSNFAAFMSHDDACIQPSK